MSRRSEDDGETSRSTLPVVTNNSFYIQMLRIRHLDPKPWHRAVFVEGSIGAAVLLVMADLASAWVLVALPVGVAVAVKFHDLVSGVLRRPHKPAPGPSLEYRESRHDRL